MGKGWIVGFSHGEFGGSLWYVTAAGNTSKQVLNDNVTQIAEIFGHVFVFTNTQGKGFNGGGIYEISDDGAVKRQIDFTAAPLVFLQTSDDGALIVTEDGLFRFDKNMEFKTDFQARSERVFSEFDHGRARSHHLCGNAFLCFAIDPTRCLIPSTVAGPIKLYLLPS